MDLKSFLSVFHSTKFTQIHPNEKTSVFEVAATNMSKAIRRKTPHTFLSVDRFRTLIHRSSSDRNSNGGHHAETKIAHLWYFCESGGGEARAKIKPCKCSLASSFLAFFFFFFHHVSNFSYNLLTVRIKPSQQNVGRLQICVNHFPVNPRHSSRC